MNYNNIDAIYRRGSILIRVKPYIAQQDHILDYNNLKDKTQSYPHIISTANDFKGKKSIKRSINVLHVDIVGNHAIFWKEYQNIIPFISINDQKKHYVKKNVKHIKILKNLNKYLFIYWYFS